MKMVLKVPTTCKNCSSCILTTVSKIQGVASLTYDQEKSTLTVVGEVDVVVVVNELRKAKHPATVVTVSDEKKEAEEKKKKDEEEKKKKEEEEKKKKAELEKWKECCLMVQPCGPCDKPPCGPRPPPYPYPYPCVAIDDSPADPCTIM